ncbi:MAG: hypothetical protein V1743_06250 [Nanoarchaeota archaeon]
MNFLKQEKHIRTAFLLSIFLLIIMAITACAPATPSLPSSVLAQRIDSAVQRGVGYLATSYVNYSYADQYLLYVYPGENLSCPFDNCRVTYRLLDAYYDVIFMKQAGINLSAISDQEEDAEKILMFLAQEWEHEHIYNTLKSVPEEGGIALDTYCILGYVMKSRNMAIVAESYLDAEDNWMADGYYAEDSWRNIADESWCIRQFIATDLNQTLSAVLAKKMAAETRAYLAANHTALDRLAVAYHALYVVSEYGKKYDDRNFAQDKAFLDAYVVHAIDDDLLKNNLMLANMLDVLLVSGSPNNAVLENIAQHLLESQEAGGYWRMTPDTPADNAQAFTTFRALIALQEYKERLSTPSAEAR